MSTAGLFSVTFVLVVPFWALIIFLPRWSVTSRIINSPLIIMPPLVVYLLLVLPRFSIFWDAFTRPNLASLQALLGSPEGAAAIWAHLIAFDLFLGRWMYLDSRDSRIPVTVMIPIYLITILVSPVGVTAYQLVRRLPSPRRRQAGAPTVTTLPTEEARSPGQPTPERRP